MASVADWSPTAASNTEVGGISTDGTITLVNQVDNIVRGMMAEVATSRDDGTIINVYPRGYLHGLTLSNNSGDATNDIDVAAGECVTSDGPYWRMALASALTKRLDAAWAVGTGNGGLDTGSIANTTYHIWLIQRSDTLVVDALFSASATAPTMPANYDRKRRIGSVIRESAAIVAFYQVGDSFRRVNSVNASTSVVTFASTLTDCLVPAGIVVQPILAFVLNLAASSSGNMSIGSALDGSTIVNAVAAVTAAGTSQNSRNVIGNGFFTNTSKQLYLSQTITGTATTANVVSLGWIDTRGRA